MKPSVLRLLLLAQLLLLLLSAVLSGPPSPAAAARPLRRETNDPGKQASRIGASDGETTTAHRETTSAHGEADDTYDGDTQGMEEEEGCGTGMEEETGEEEEEEDQCTKRRTRMMAEAHLDYIYTQRHSHP